MYKSPDHTKNGVFAEHDMQISILCSLHETPSQILLLQGRMVFALHLSEPQSSGSLNNFDPMLKTIRVDGGVGFGVSSLVSMEEASLIPSERKTASLISSTFSVDESGRLSIQVFISQIGSASSVF